jgi:uncharacterized membrane protein YphA (DoxX/SURF4 family)
MGPILIVCQVAAALGLLNVWLLRSNRATSYRGGGAQSMREEFAAYGLPAWCVAVVGGLKVGAAVALLAGIWYPALVRPAAAVVGVLMLGALAMHRKVRDPLKKYLPAAVMLALSVALLLGDRTSAI